MRSDIPFLNRADWLDEHGNPRFKTMCPVSQSERLKRLSAIERREAKPVVKEGEADGGAAASEGNQARPLSVLEQQYDWELHQMLAYMRRLDGATETIKKLPRMDPLAPDGEAKHALDGSKTPYFGWWTYVAWYNVFVPVLTKTFGNVLNVLDEDDLDRLLGATVQM